MDKYQRMDKVSLSNLSPQDKTLLNYLILRADSQGLCWPLVETLCQVRGIKHTKNFRGADYYLPEFVTKTKKGRKLFYVLNWSAIEALEESEVEVKQTPYKSNTPSQEGYNTPATAENTPARADDTPSDEGANKSTLENTLDSSSESTYSEPVVADAPTHSPNSSIEEVKGTETTPIRLTEDSSIVKTDVPGSVERTPADEGVSQTFDLQAHLAKCKETSRQSEERYWKNHGRKVAL